MLIRGLQSAIPDQRGTTLIELLVILSAGMIVFAALFGILDVAIHQTSRVVSRTDATQQARRATNTLERELNSSCVGDDNFPIQTGSDANTLIFLSAEGSDPTPTPVKHVVTYTPGTPHGTLTDDTYTGPVDGPWTTFASSDTLLTNVDQDGSKPVFQYYAYETPKDAGGGAYIDQAGNTYQMILDGNDRLPSDARTALGLDAGDQQPGNSPFPLPTPLTDATVADTVAEVAFNFVALPGGGQDVDSTLDTSSATINDTVGLRLTPPDNHATASAVYPCS